MKAELKYLHLAILFFTRLPLPEIKNFQASDQHKAIKYFPLVGILVGCFVATIFQLTQTILPKDIAILLSMLTGLLLTGGFHEDGLADSMDGLGGGWQAEHVLTIMQDSRLGTYGVLALNISLLLKFQTLNALPTAQLAWCLIAAHSISRLAALWVMTRLTYLRTNSKAKDIVSHLPSQERLIAATFGLSPLLFNPLPAIIALIPVVLVWIYFVQVLKKRLAGYTGDCLGAMQQLTEISFYLGLLVWFRL